MNKNNTAHEECLQNFFFWKMHDKLKKEYDRETNVHVCW
jgi:hypothetical protein